MMPSDIRATMIGRRAVLATKETNSTDSDGKLQFTCEGDRQTYVIGDTDRLPRGAKCSELSVLRERGASLDVRTRTSIVIGRPS
jgi:hypothetical protein